MSYRKAFLASVLILGLALFAGACKGKKGDVDTTPAPPPAPAEPTPAPEPEPTEVDTGGFEQAEPETQRIVEPTLEELNRQLAMTATVYFDYDKFDLGDETRRTLRSNAEFLKSNSGAFGTVVIEGHCDERGSLEYNIALGQKRANAVREYLASLGVASQMRTVSYGEERPADRGHTESAWAKNRRAEFVVER